MHTKAQQLQIRVTAAQKAALKRRAKAAGVGVSEYALSMLLPSEQDRFTEIVALLRAEDERRFALAELNDFLHALAPAQFADAVRVTSLAGLPALVQNYVAAMVELAAAQKGVRPPTWVRTIVPLVEPYFATPMKSLRLHLLASSPVPFRRRNLFVDSSVGARV